MSIKRNARGCCPTKRFLRSRNLLSNKGYKQQPF